MPRGRALKNPNGYGSVVKLSGKRRHPFEVRVNTRMDERYYPVYDVLGHFSTREEALIALAEYNKAPYNISDRELTFSQLYEKFYKNKYELSGKAYSQSSMTCTKSAYGHCEGLYDLAYRKLRADDFRAVLHLLWVESVRADLDAIRRYRPKKGTFKSGLKTAAGKNRIVPIHSKIRGFVEHRLAVNPGALFAIKGNPATTQAYTKLFKSTLRKIAITTYHTPHDCRHTFTSLLDSADVNQVCIDRLIGHASRSITMRTYTHKTIEELRQAIEMI